MKEKLLSYIKENKLPTITVILWAITIVSMFVDKISDTFGGLVFLAAIVMTIIAAKNYSKNKKSINQVNIETNTFAEFIEINGKKYHKAYSYDRVEIYGVEYCSGLELFKGETLYVVPEPTNQADPEAVVINAIRNGVTYKIGYLPRDNRLKSMVNDYYRYNNVVQAYCDNPNTYSMAMAFYKEDKNN